MNFFKNLERIDTMKDNGSDEQKDGFQIVSATTETQEPNQESKKSHVLEFTKEKDIFGDGNNSLNKRVVEEKPKHAVTFEKNEGKSIQGEKGNGDTFVGLVRTNTSSRIEGTTSDLESKNRSHEVTNLKMHATTESIPPPTPPKSPDLSALKNGEGHKKWRGTRNGVTREEGREVLACGLHVHHQNRQTVTIAWGVAIAKVGSYVQVQEETQEPLAMARIVKESESVQVQLKERQRDVKNLLRSRPRIRATSNPSKQHKNI